MVIAFAVAVVTVPVGVSGAVFLVPVQVSLLDVASPAVTPTNLLYNIVAVPGALWRYRTAEGFRIELVRAMLVGTLPGVVAGAVVRVEVAPGGGVFRLVIAGLLAPLGVWLLVERRAPDGTRLRFGLRWVATLAAATGFVGGVYGIGGGSILGPVLVAAGYPIASVAPSALVTTLLTSVAGVITFSVLAITGGDSAAPVWHLGVLLGTGGLVGGYVGARVQSRLPVALLKRGLGVLSLLLAASYVVAASAT
ncbi:MAG: uncharacterized protein QOF76_3129 [Solirubrobacteraceae bacterium]|nr:uncharacterized protein [Solirubrobacteraceae bacterium]